MRRLGGSRSRSEADPRLAVFCAGEGPEVFRSVCHRHEIWREDPFDVPTIHEEARDAFARLLNQATTPPGLPAGRTLLILGESGAGKTHLMRVFRNHVHSRRLGYCGYLQMTSATDDYGRYVLSNLIDSLDQPYYEPSSDGSGLMCLSDALVEIPSSVLAGRSGNRSARIASTIGSSRNSSPTSPTRSSRMNATPAAMCTWCRHCCICSGTSRGSKAGC